MKRKLNAKDINPGNVAKAKTTFWSNVENVSFLTDEDCWNWIGFKTIWGHGNIGVFGLSCLAHKLSYCLFKNIFA